MGLTIQGAGYLSSKQTRLAGGAGRCAFQLNRVWGWDAALRGSARRRPDVRHTGAWALLGSEKEGN